MDPVQTQVDAYNARDIDAFVAAYADDVVISDHRRQTAARRGRGDARAVRRPVRRHPRPARRDPRAGSVPATGRSTTNGSRDGDETRELLVAYLVEGDTIRRVLMLG